MTGALAKIILLFYILCYSSGLVGLLSSILSARSRRGTMAAVHDRRFAFLSASFAAVVIPYSILSYLETLGGITTTAGLAIFAVSLVGDVGLIIALPHFMDGFLSPPRGIRDEKPWIVLSALAAAAGVVYMLAPARFFYVGYFTFLCLLAAIVQVIIRGGSILARLRTTASEEEDPDAGKWAGLLSGFRLLTAIAFIPMVMIDFFPTVFAWRIPGFPGAFRVFPLLYAGLNLLYAVRSLGPLFAAAPAAGRRAGPNLAAAAAAAGLSRREIEVAELLAEGASYKDICSRLRITIGTAQSHVVRVYRKLGVSCKEDVMRLARGEGRLIE